MERLLWVCAGGAVGSGLRYGLSSWVATLAGTRLPLGTFAVNVIGSFLIGAIMQFGMNSTLLSPLSRLALTTGVLGGFTTYSTFSYETVTSLGEGAYALAFANVALTLLTCTVACAIGIGAGRWLAGA